MQYIYTIFFSFVLAACAPQIVNNPDLTSVEIKLANPQMLNDTPDLSPYGALEITSNSTSKREVGQIRYFADGSYVEVRFANPDIAQRLYVQVEECRNSKDPLCQRRFFLSGDLMAFSSHLRCYIQIRNDSNSGYYGQALQGYCQDNNSRSFSIILSK